MEEVLVEAHPGVGGEEAKRWAGEVTRMLLRYSALQGWDTEEISPQRFTARGEGVWQGLEPEAGVHEVQRVPRGGHYNQMHSSTCSVAVLLLPQDNQVHKKDLTVYIEPNQTKVLHRPSGLIATLPQSGNPLQDISRAQTILEARLGQLNGDSNLMRKEDLARGERARRIRTYNFHEGRVKDHRTGRASYDLQRIIRGHLGQLTAGRP